MRPHDHKSGESLMSQSKATQVTFIPKPGGAYEMIQGGHDKTELIFNKDNEKIGGQKMNHKDHFLVEFVLDNRYMPNLLFPPNPMNALWVNSGPPPGPPPCPTSAAYNDEFYAVGVDPSGGSLTVRNDDTKIEVINFTLRLLPMGADPRDQGNYVAYDPIGQNQDGGVRQN
jgi:hypothetical protein